MVAEELIVGAPVCLAQIDRFIPGTMILDPECEADKPSRSWWGSLAWQANNVGFNRAIFEFRCFDDCDRLSARWRTGDR